jgi:phage terminase Nu1 subunit (DNA packaging protein)
MKKENDITTRYVSRSGLAAVFGVAMPTVDAWVRNGCPYVQKGGRGVEWKFDTADVSKWKEQRAVEAATGNTAADESELKRRKLAAETAHAELELAKAKNEVAPVREFERAQAMLMAAIQQNILNVPSRAVLQLLGETDEMIFKTKLKAELAMALETAASTELQMPDDENDE